MARITKVYVANRSSHDYRPAYKFGELIFITKGDLNKFAVGELFRTFAEVLRDSTEDDFFLPTSLPILSSIGSAILAHKHGRVKYLLFRNGEYIVRTIDLGEL